jgi:ribose transport system substrate-binding protein
LTAAMMKKAGRDVPATIDVPFRMKQVVKGMCNPTLPEDASVSTLLDDGMLKAMFTK